MREVFLAFLLVIAVILVAGYVICAVRELRSGEGGGAWSWSSAGSPMIVAGILAVAGHAAGAGMSALPGG